MTSEEIVNFAKSIYVKEHKVFERVTNPRSSYPELHALIILEERKILSNKLGLDLFWVDSDEDVRLDEIDTEQLAAQATEEFITELVRCGVNFLGPLPGNSVDLYF